MLLNSYLDFEIPVMMFWCHVELHVSMKSQIKKKKCNDNIPPLPCCGQITVSKIDQICPLAIWNQISTVSMHIPSLWKSSDIYTSYRPETTEWKFGRQITVKYWRNLPHSSPKPDLHNTNTHTKSGENPFTFYQFIVLEMKIRTGGRTD